MKKLVLARARIFSFKITVYSPKIKERQSIRYIGALGFIFLELNCVLTYPIMYLLY
jgi:hypothetical protein